MQQWNNRIAGTADVDPRQLLAHPYNHRIHSRFQMAALSGAIREIGVWKHVTVNKRTGRIIDGHARVALAIDENQATVPVAYVALSEEEEAAAIALGDAIAALADNDAVKLEELLGMFDTTDPALAELLDSMHTDATAVLPQDVHGDSDGDNDKDPKKNKRNLGDQKAQIKPVLYAEQIQIFEKALLRAVERTGTRNRGEALISICKAYLNEDAGDDILARLTRARV
jgi:hypothetical protein